MATRIPLHAHCRQCDRPMEYGRDFCSEGCEAEFRQRIRKKRNQYIVLLAIGALLFLFSMLTRG